MLRTLLIGFFIGVVAKWFMPGDDPKGCIYTALLGIGGAWVGGKLFGGPAGFIASVIGAILLLWIYRVFLKSR